MKDVHRIIPGKMHQILVHFFLERRRDFFERAVEIAG
jgi:hypothetical protein